MGSVAKHRALGFVLGADQCCEFRGWEERIAAGEAHSFREEVAPRKVSAADLVVVMSGIAAERLLVSLEQFYFAMNGEHLLHKGSPKMEQAKRERPFIFRVKGLLRLLQVFA